MRKNWSLIIVPLIAIALLIFLYHVMFVRIVNYEIGGINIPSEYNFFTSKVKPIADYKGKKNIRTVHSRRAERIGLTDDEVFAAKLRWAVFEGWANSRPEYKGWDTNPEIFKKANAEFRKSLQK